jgi:ATP-dependent helicase/nuclease subunit B
MVLAGPAGSGKTAALVGQYRHVLADRKAGKPSIGSTAWIAPTRQAADEIRGQLVHEGLRGCFSPAIYTFEQFARAIIAHSDQPPRFLGRMLKRQLVKRLISDSLGEGRLTYFAPIAQTGGLIDLVCGFISDLKRQAVRPERLARLAESSGASEKTRELAALYSRYEQLLRARQLFDAEEQFLLASAFLEGRPADQQGPFANLRLMVVDGFSDFTAAQHAILECFSRRVAGLEQLVISLPLEEPCGRDDLFEKSMGTYQELKRRHRKLETRWMKRKENPPWPAMAHIEQNMFSNPRGARPAPDTRGLETIEASSQRAEIEILARRIKELLVHPDRSLASLPVRPSEIAVVFRSLEGNAPLVEQIFAEYGIPSAIDCRKRLFRAPVLKALVEFLKLQASDWPFRQLLAVLANNFFQPSWPEWRSPHAAAATEWAIRQMQVPRGRRKLLGELRHRASPHDESHALEAEGDRTNESDAKRRKEREAFQAAWPVLERMSKVLSELDRPRTLSQWNGALEDLAHEFGILHPKPQRFSPTRDGGGERDRARNSDHVAWDRLKEVLSAQQQLEQWLLSEPEQLPLNEFILRLQDALSVETLTAEHDDAGRVRVLAAHAVRGLEIPYLFVAGLAEQSFPPPLEEDQIHSDVELRQLLEAGLRFSSSRERACEEMLLFYETITRATRRLVLSYPALDAKAQELLESPYLTELKRCCGTTDIARTRDESLSPVPADEHSYCLREERLKAIAQLVDGKPQLFATVLRRATTPAHESSLIAGLKSTTARRGKEFSDFEGILHSAAAKQRLARRFGPDHCWSASALEEYATCPFRFFASSVLGLEQVPELSLDTDYRQRGFLTHELLAELHRRLSKDGKLQSPRAAGAGEFLRVKDGAIQWLVERFSSGDPLEAALRKVDFKLIADWMEEYFGQHEKYETTDEQTLRPACFEVSFGMKRRTGERVDPISTEKAFELNRGDEIIRFSGRIDRIDIGMVGGEVVFNVIDYKTGGKRAFRAKDIASGRAVQLPLYALAVQELLMIDRRAKPWRVGYWFLKDGGFDSLDIPQFYRQTAEGLCETDDWNALRGTLLSRVMSLVHGVREGQFPVYSLDEECTGRCEYHSICRIGQVRSLGKNPDDTQPQPGARASNIATS